MSGGGTQTVQQQSSPNPQFLAAYENANSAAQRAASAPFQTPQAPVAGFSPGQATGAAEVNNLQGVAQPYINQANQYIQAGAQPLTPMQFSAGAVQQYESPYTQQVVGSTEQQFNNQNQQQQQGIVGNAVSEGAWGGDRSAVAQGITAGQQQLAEAPVIAGLENQGYSQALGEFNQQQTTGLGAQEAQRYLSSQAGFGESNLGNEALSTGLQGANAELGVGSLQQGEQQAQLNAPYEQELAQQAYPFQTAQYEANIAEGLGSNAGGSSSTTQPGPSSLSQGAGLGLAGLGILGGTGAFGTAAGGAGWLSGLAALLRSGGQVPSRAPGGDVPGIPGGGIAGVVDIVPPTNPTHGAGLPRPPQPVSAQNTGISPMGVLGTLKESGALGDNGWLSGMHGGTGASSPLPEPPIPPAGGPPAQARGGTIRPNFGLGGIIGVPNAPRAPGLPHQPRGIAAASRPYGIRSLPKLAGGGGVEDGTGDDPPSDAVPVTITGSDSAALPEPPIPPASGPPPAGIAAAAPQSAGDSSALPEPPIPPADGASAAGIAAAVQPQPAGDVQTSVTPSSGAGIAASHGRSPPSNSDIWTTILATGLGIAGGRSPFAGVNIGQGGLEGLKFGTEQQKEHTAEAQRQQQIEQTGKYQAGELDLRGKQLTQTGDLTKAQMAQTLTLKQQELAQERALRLASLGQEASIAQQRLALEREGLIPPDVREEQAFDKMTPEQRVTFGQYQMSKKGLVDIFGNPTVSSAVNPNAPNLTGEDYLKTLNPQVQPMVKALAEGRMAMPSRPTPQQQQIIMAVSQYDPTFDATDFNKRNRTAVDFSSAGNSGKAVTAINTAMNHMSKLQDQLGALGNGDLPAVNAVSNWFKENTGEAGPTTAAGTRDAVANELRRVFATTGAGGLEELKDWQSHFPVNGSPAQQQQAIKNAVELVEPRLESLRAQYRTGMGVNHGDLDLLSPEAQQAYRKITGGESPLSGAQAPSGNSPPVPGARPGRDGRWYLADPDPKRAGKYLMVQ